MGIVAVVILVGETGSAKIVEKLKGLGWGRMYVEKKPKPYDGEPWGFDDAAFLAFRRGQPFPEDLFQKRLAVAVEIGTRWFCWHRWFSWHPPGAVITFCPKCGGFTFSAKEVLS